MITPYFAGVLDGSSSRVSVGGRSSGRFAAEAGAEAIAELHPESDLNEAAHLLAQALATALEGAAAANGPSADQPAWGARNPSFAMILFSVHRRELWRVADCQFLIDGRGRNPGIAVDAITARARALVTRGLRASGQPISTLLLDDPGYHAIVPLFEGQFGLINHPSDEFGYGVINGTPVPERYLETIPVPTDADDLVLASDGYPTLLPSLEDSERALVELHARDPLLVDEFLSARGVPIGAEWYDDRAYLRLRLTP